MKINKRTKNIVLISLIIMFCIYIGARLTKKSFSLGDNVSDDFISSNISRLNTVLETRYETDNPYYMSEIVDENGNVPAYNSYNTTALIPSRAINDLVAYNDKIFLGVGDYDKNTGPTKMVYYDTKTGKIDKSGNINDEEVLSFKIIDGQLYTTGADPRYDWKYGHYFIYNAETNLWVQHLFSDGWIHVFDVAKYHDKMFMSGSVTGDKSIIQVSNDNGVTFTDAFLYKDGVKLPLNTSMRCYKLFDYQDDLYGVVYFNESTTIKYKGIYKYDESKNQFNYITNPPSFTYSTNALNTAWHNWLYFNNTTYKDNFLFIAGFMYKMNKTEDGSVSFERLYPNFDNAVVDTVIVDDVLYLLSYKYVSSKNYETKIYSTEDLNSYNLIYETNLDTVPFAITYHDNNFYIGTWYDSASNVDKTGSLYKVDMNKFKNYLTLNSTNKTIDITKDGITYPVSYNLYSDESVFKTTLTFNKNMTKKQWEQEYTKFKNLNLIYSIVDNKMNVNLDNSTTYYDNIINNNINTTETEYSSAIQFANSLFSKELDIQDERFNIKSENIVSNDDETQISITLTIPNIDTVTSNKYLVDDKNNFIYIGADNKLSIIRNNIESSDIVTKTVDLINNKLILKYNGNIIREYTLIRFTTEREISDKYIYMSNYTNEEILSSINIINGKLIIKDDKLQIKFNDLVVDEYNIMRFSSDKIKILDNKIAYISNYSINEIKNSLITVNIDSVVYNDKIVIKKDDIIYDSFNIININFGILRENNKSVLIPESYSYENFIKNVIVNSEITYKILKDSIEITNGNIDKNMVLKLYYNNNEIDSFNFIIEYLNFDQSILVDDNNKYLYNISFNTTVAEMLSKIDTSGTITIKNNNDGVISNNLLVGTGSKVSIKFISKEIDYTIIINGDINGNGILEMSDILNISNYIYKDKKDLGGVYLLAADYDSNDIYNLEDVMKAARALTGGN